MGTTNAAWWTREHRTALRRITLPPRIFGTIILTWQFWLGLLMAIHTAIAIDTFTANASGAVVSVRTITHRRKHGQSRYDMYPVFSFSDKDGNRHTVQSIIGETGRRDKSPTWEVGAETDICYDPMFPDLGCAATSDMKKYRNGSRSVAGDLAFNGGVAVGATAIALFTAVRVETEKWREQRWRAAGDAGRARWRVRKSLRQQLRDAPDYWGDDILSSEPPTTGRTRHPPRRRIREIPRATTSPCTGSAPRSDTCAGTTACYDSRCDASRPSGVARLTACGGTPLRGQPRPRQEGRGEETPESREE